MSNSLSNEKDINIKVIDILIMLLEDQTGERYEYRQLEVNGKSSVTGGNSNYGIVTGIEI